MTTTSSNRPHRTARIGVVIPVRTEPAKQVIGVVRELCVFVPTATIVIVDDSDEPHWRQFESELSDAFPGSHVQLLHRSDATRWGRLAGAVFDGFRSLREQGIDLAGCLDGDGQHDPAALQAMAHLLSTTDADAVVASRYSCDGSPGSGLSPVRMAASRACHLAARTLFPTRTRGCHDTMSGCFMIRLSCLELDNTWVHRFKVLLQVLVQHPGLRVAEVGYTFRSRELGESHAGVDEAKAYAQCLAKLFRLAYFPPALQYAKER